MTAVATTTSPASAAGSGPANPADVRTSTAHAVRRTFRRHAGGVAVITAAGPDGPVGFTATSLASVSLDPPLLSFNISHGSSSWPVVSRAEHVAVHVLGAAHAQVAARFARSGIDRFAAPTTWFPGPFDVPVLGGVASWLVAQVHHRLEVGDHTLVVAEVVHAAGGAGDGDPLIYHDGRFATLSPLAGAFDDGEEQS